MKTKQIKVAMLNKIDLQEQKNKVVEEVQEMFTAFNDYMHYKFLSLKDTENLKEQLISECYDVIQSISGMIDILEEGASSNEVHIEKMKKYVESGRINNKSKTEE